MINKKHLTLSIFLFFIFTLKVSANVIISEVQIAPTENRFIELYNDGSSSVDLTNWYIQRKTVTGSTFGSLVSKTNFEGESIPAGDYFVISKTNINNSDILVDDLTLTESNVIQLKNAEQVVVDKIGWGDVSDCDGDCAPNPINGKSIQRVDNHYIISTPTPGSTNQNNTSNDSDDTSGDNNDSSQSSSSSGNSYTKEALPPLKINTKINIPKVIVAGDPFTFESVTTTNRKEIYKVGRFLWNFGDGMMTWTKDSGPFEYVYEYPGEYVLTLSYFDNSFNKVPDAIDRVVVKVIDSGLSVIGVGPSHDPYVELENDSPSEIDLSGWKIIAGAHIFSFSDGTNILSKKKMKLSPKITGFTDEDIKNVIITNPSGEVISIYPLKKKNTYNKNTRELNYRTDNNMLNKNNNLETFNEESIINLDNLGASVGESTSKIPKSFYPIIVLIVVIGIGITSFFLIRNKTNKNKELESEINADDIKIIE